MNVNRNGIVFRWFCDLMESEGIYRNLIDWVGSFFIIFNRYSCALPKLNFLIRNASYFHRFFCFLNCYRALLYYGEYSRSSSDFYQRFWQPSVICMYNENLILNIFVWWSRFIDWTLKAFPVRKLAETW